MGSFLMVPIHLDALCLETDLSVVGAKCDFTRLPYWDGEREVNPDIANISEELVSIPFQDRGLQLRAGVHLHWALPDALTKGMNTTEKTTSTRKLTFPAVPNRWLVTRSGKDDDRKLRIERQWVVESDFLYPDADGDVQGGVAVPFPSDPANGKYQPYRYLGRKRPFNAQWAEDPAADSLMKSGYQLTAVGFEPRPNSAAAKIGGYGEPTFAAFYPNCQGVFGLHDSVPPATLTGTQYEVIGWYSDPALDCLRADTFLQAIEAVRKAMPSATDAEVTSKALEEAFKWQAPATGDLPDRTICYARLDIAAAETPAPVMPEKAVSVAVGNTGTEALSAYLAVALAAAEPELFQAIDSPPQKLTMLIDPRGAAHASSGVLPTKAIRIPPDQYAEALRNLEITFLSTPVVTTQGKINLPLPAEPGYAWSWLAKSGGEWATSEIGPVNLQATWSGQQEIREGWLKLSKQDS